jgi:hypothetical protein
VKVGLLVNRVLALVTLNEAGVELPKVPFDIAWVAAVRLAVELGQYQPVESVEVQSTIAPKPAVLKVGWSRK